VLDVTIERGVAYGGWCPKGGWAEDLPEPPGLLAKYPLLQETPLADPAQRTEWNVRDAGACMILADSEDLAASAGTALAEELAHRFRRPLLIVNLAEAERLHRAGLWLQVQKSRHGENLKLAIGGPRESEAPGIYGRAAEFLRSLLGS
jgi:hypothetical protein